MRTYTTSVFAFALAIGLGACGDSSNTANGTGGAGGAGGTGGVGTGGTGGGTMVSVTGTVASVTAEGEPTPLEGATVAVVGTANTAVSDAQGNFSIVAPTGTAMFLVTANGHWGSLFADDIPAQGLMDLEAEVISDALVEGVGAQLGLLTPPSTSKGLVAVAFDDTTVEGGETASIDVNSGTSFIFDAQEDPMIGDTLVMDGGSDVIFIDVDVASEVTAMATTAGDAPCPLEHPSASYAVQAKVLTEIDVACPAQ